MKILNLVQGSEAWHKARDEHFTASECPAMMGDSKYKSRGRLMKDKKGFKEVISEQLQKRFDQGHETEEKARDLLEFETADSFEAAVASIEIDGLKLLASLDGLSDDSKTIFEHKLWNETLAENVRNNVLEPTYYWQLEQQLLVFGAVRVLFMVSDGTANKREIMYYQSVPERREKLIAGWKQFAIDLENFKLEAKREIVVGAQNHLPAITYKVTGTEISTNIGVCLEQIKEMAQEEMSKTLETDQDFADKDQLNKDVKKARAALKESISKVRGEFVSYSQFEEIAQDMDVVLQKMQSHGEKQVKAAKIAKKKAIEDAGALSIGEHIHAVNAAINPMMLSSLMNCSVDFVSAMKNKRTIESLVNAVDGVVAEFKISANELKDKVIANLSTLRELAGEYEFLFMDTQELVIKENDDLIAVIKMRIADHEASEEKRLAEQKAKIEAEAKEKAEREAQVKLDADREKIRQEEQVKARAEQQAKSDKEAAERAEAKQAESNKTGNDIVDNTSELNKILNNADQSVVPEPSSHKQEPTSEAGNLSMAETMANAAPTLASSEISILTYQDNTDEGLIALYVNGEFLTECTYEDDPEMSFLWCKELFFAGFNAALIK